MSTTFAEVLGAHGITIPDETLAELEVPVLTGPQRQGDVAVFPRGRNGEVAVLDERGQPVVIGPLTAGEVKLAKLVPSEGIAVVRGEATGNTHLLHAAGTCRWLEKGTALGGDSVLLGVLEVGDGAECFLIHTDEHGANGIGPGTYRLHGKREQADEIRRVHD